MKLQNPDTVYGGGRVLSRTFLVWPLEVSDPGKPISPGQTKTVVTVMWGPVSQSFGRILLMYDLKQVFESLLRIVGPICFINLTFG